MTSLAVTSHQNHDSTPTVGATQPNSAIPPFQYGDSYSPPPLPLDPVAQAIQAISQSLSDVFTITIGQVHPSTQPNQAKYPKARDPSVFSGNHRKCLSTWIGETEICFHTAPHLYRTETSKVMFAGSFLT